VENGPSDEAENPNGPVAGNDDEGQRPPMTADDDADDDVDEECTGNGFFAEGTDMRAAAFFGSMPEKKKQYEASFFCFNLPEETSHCLPGASFFVSIYRKKQVIARARQLLEQIRQ
jgi:hypothetical protein